MATYLTTLSEIFISYSIRSNLNFFVISTKCCEIKTTRSLHIQTVSYIYIYIYIQINIYTDRHIYMEESFHKSGNFVIHLCIDAYVQLYVLVCIFDVIANMQNDNHCNDTESPNLGSHIHVRLVLHALAWQRPWYGCRKSHDNIVANCCVA